MKTSDYLQENIEKVQAKCLGNGFFRIQAVMVDGSVLTLLPRSKRSPSAVQLFKCRANGNCSGDSIGKFFTYAKSTKNVMYPSKHLKSYLVETVSA